MRKFLLRLSDETIENVVEAGADDLSPPGYELIEAIAGVDIGWIRQGDGSFINPNPPAPEPDPEPTPQWEAFNLAFLANAYWQAVSAQLPAQVLMGVAATAANANAPNLQSAYNIAKTVMAQVGQDIPDEALREWQGIANQFNIPITF